MKKFFICFFSCLFLLLTTANATTVSALAAGEEVSQISILRKYKDIGRNLRVTNKIKNQARGLSDEEKTVIKKYVLGAVRGEDTFLLINCNLNGTLDRYIAKKEITNPLKCRLDYYANQLSVPIRRTKLPQNMLLYRGVDNKEIQIIFKDKKLDNYITKPINDESLKFVKQKLVGAKYVEKGFMLTSYDINNTNQTKFVFIVNAPKNLQAVFVDELCKKNNKEILINKNSTWEVTDVTIGVSKKTKQEFYKINIKLVK